ncbi:3679_t:CDS:2 [Paraglomus occultum]|uniref:3679_t:CDS:1 n=1 Tax=Paraglomus occultum TaxID=144539 RepID=A0A9N9BV59_9GLOM|nr:3679_t:CDS:2 [Paraglomus occultum]
MSLDVVGWMNLAFILTYSMFYVPERFATLDGAEWPFGYLISAACIFSSAGFVNSVIYGVTRNFISLQPITSRFQRAFRKTLGTRCISESMMSDGEDSFTAESLYQRTDNGLSIKVEEMDERGKGKQRETMANRDIENDDIVEDDSSTYDQYSREKKEPGKEVKVHNNINNECDNDGVSIEQSNNRSRIIPSIIQNSASSWKFLEQFVVNFGKRNSSTLNVEV